MTNEKILQLLYAAKTGTDAEPLEKLICEFETRVRADAAPRGLQTIIKSFPRSWAAHTRCHKDSRPVLQYGDTQDWEGKQYQFVTDTYMLIGFAVPRLQEAKDAKAGNFPPVTRVIPTLEALEGKPEIIITLADCKAAIAKAKADDPKEARRCCPITIKGVTINALLAEKALKWTGSTEISFRQTGDLKPLRGTSAHGDVVVLMPVRVAR